MEFSVFSFYRTTKFNNSYPLLENYQQVSTL
jgi:hypothetical protein